MSLTSLRGYAGLASTALDTARSTFKAMADAAVQPEDTAAAPREGEAAQPAAEPKPTAAEAKPSTRKGVRLGTLLDAYA